MARPNSTKKSDPGCRSCREKSQPLAIFCRRIHAVLPSARHDLIQSRALTLCKTTTSVFSEQATISSAHLHCTTATSNLLYLQLKILVTSTFTQTSVREKWPLQTPQDKPDPGCRSCRGTHSPGCSLPSLRHATLHVKYQNEKAPWGQAAHTSHLAQDQPPTSHATIFDTYPVPHKHISHLSARSTVQKHNGLTITPCPAKPSCATHSCHHMETDSDTVHSWMA